MDAVASRLAADYHPLACSVAVATHLFHDRPEALSIAGEAVCQAAQAWVDAGETGTDGFAAYVTTVVRRRCVDEYRRQRGRSPRSAKRRAQASMLRLDGPALTSADNGKQVTLAETVADPVDVADEGCAAIAARQMGRWLEVVIASARLTDRDRLVMDRLVGGVTQQAVAAELGVTPARVCQLWSAVRVKLRKAAVRVDGAVT